MESLWINLNQNANLLVKKAPLSNLLKLILTQMTLNNVIISKTADPNVNQPPPHQQLLELLATFQTPCNF